MSRRPADSTLASEGRLRAVDSSSTVNAAAHGSSRPGNAGLAPSDEAVAVDAPSIAGAAYPAGATSEEGAVLIVMESVIDKLTLLRYDEDYLRGLAGHASGVHGGRPRGDAATTLPPRRRPPLARVHFAMPLPNRSRTAQFGDAVSLATWLLRRLGRDPPRWDLATLSPTAIAASLIAALQEAGLSPEAAAAISPASLTPGFGGPMCSVLSWLLDRVISAEAFVFRRPAAAAAAAASAVGGADGGSARTAAAEWEREPPWEVEPVDALIVASDGSARQAAGADEGCSDGDDGYVGVARVGKDEPGAVGVATSASSAAFGSLSRATTRPRKAHSGGVGGGGSDGGNVPLPGAGIEATVSSEAWAMELERVAPRLRAVLLQSQAARADSFGALVGGDCAAARELWRGRLDATRSSLAALFGDGLLAAASPASTVLHAVKELATSADATLAGIGAGEARLLTRASGGGGRLGDGTWAEVAAEYASLRARLSAAAVHVEVGKRSVDAAAEELARVSDQLASAESDMARRSEGASDSAPLSRLRRASAALKHDVLSLQLRIGIASAALFAERTHGASERHASAAHLPESSPAEQGPEAFSVAWRAARSLTATSSSPVPRIPGAGTAPGAAASVFITQQSIR